MTFEVNLGFGWLRLAADNGDTETESALGGLNLGLGGWVGPRTALTVRIAGVTYSDSSGTLTGGFIGGAVQRWIDDRVWFGAGAGIGFLSLDLDSGSDPDPETGLGLDFRAGVSLFNGGQHSMNVSFEVNPSFLDGGTVTGIALLLGYQYL